MQSSENDVSTRLSQIEAQLCSLHERNRRVELEKSWETSTARKIAIVILTYVLMCVVFLILGVPKFWLNAIVPTVGYFLSTQSLPLIKSRWIKHHSHDAKKL